MSTSSNPLTKILDWLFGYDFFISYSHDDGLRYAKGLFNELSQRNEDFQVHLDTKSYVAGNDLGFLTARRIRQSETLIILARENALLNSDWVHRECSYFLSKGKTPIIIDINHSVSRYQRSLPETAPETRSAALIDILDTENWLMLRESIGADNNPIDDGHPSPHIISELVRSFSSTRQQKKRLRFLMAACVLSFIAIVILVAQVLSISSKNQELSVAESTALARLAVERSNANAPMEALSLLNQAIYADDGSLRAHSEALDKALISVLYKPHPIKILTEHSEAVTALDIASGTAQLLSGAVNGELYLWDLGDSQTMTPLPPHRSRVTDVAISPSERYGLSTADDQIVRLLDLSTGALIAQHRIGGSMARTVDINAINENLFLLPMAGQKSVRILDFSDSWKIVGDLKHPDIVSTAVFSPDGNKILTTAGKRLYLWEAALCVGRYCEPRMSLVANDREIRDAQFNRTADRVGAVGSDATMRLWTIDGSKTEEVEPDTQMVLEPGELNQQLYERALDSIAFSEDSRYVITGAANHAAQIWHTDTGKLLATLAGHNGRVTDALFMEGNQYSITASEDSTIRVWDNGRTFSPQTFTLGTGRVAYALPTVNGEIIYAVMDNRLFTLDTERSTILDEVDLAKIITTSTTTSFSPRSLALNHDETRLLLPGQGAVSVLDAKQLTLINTFPVHQRKVMWAAFSPDGKQIATAGGDERHAALIDAETGAVINRFDQVHTDWVEYVDFHPSGNYLLSAGRDGRIVVWDIQTSKPASVLTEHGDWIMHAAFNADGSHIIAASKEQTVIWDWQSERRESVHQGHESLVYTGAFHPTVDMFATASQNGTVIVWSYDGQTVAKFRAHEASVRSIRYFADGSRIMTTSDDGSIKLWDTAVSEAKQYIGSLCVALSC